MLEIWMLRVILVKALKKKKCKESLIFLDNTQSTKMLVEICMVKAILRRSQAEIRNMLLEARGKAILAIQWHRIWMNYICVLLLWKIELTSNEIGYLA